MDSPGRLSGIRVLVVEDHADTRELVKVVLSHAGAIVTTVASARQALVAVGGASRSAPPRCR
jgi:CheY-like chemotaxis protein